jgi:sugar O-acyltransferase (sialic acid O-acetyltransferase NeuD family)
VEAAMSGKPVVIFGTGDFARVASVYLAQDSPHEVAAFTVHRQYLAEPTLIGKPVVPFEELREAYPPERYAMLVATGFKGVNKVRASIYHTCKELGYGFITYACSKAVVWGEVEIGENTFIFEQNVIQPFVKIGANTVLWSGNHIGHDATIGSHCFITSHVVVSGRVTIGDYCFVGVNSTIRDGVSVGPESVIGAGAVVLKDVAPASVLKGTAAELSPVPSHRLKAI